MPKRSFRDILLDKIPDDGTAIGNMTLIKKLDWDEDRYWSVRDDLVNDGIIALGKGKGGSVFRVIVKKVKASKLPKEVPYKREKDLYKPFHDIISSKFIKDKKIKNFVSQITASQGSKSTGGKWSRPDIIIVAVNTYSFIPGKVMDIISFEIKTGNDFDVSGVFETAAHSKYATKSYLCVYLPKGWNNEDPEFERIKSECERFGIGLMYFTSPEDYAAYDILVEPKRRNPDPIDMDTFISIQLSEKNKKHIAEYLH